MSALVDQSIQQDPRRQSRDGALIGVKFRRKGEAWFRTKVTDMSPAGFRLLSFVKLRVGMEVWIMFPGFDGRKARVMWVANHEAGCTFESPLHPAIFDHIVRTADTASRR